MPYKFTKPFLVRKDKIDNLIPLYINNISKITDFATIKSLDDYLVVTIDPEIVWKCFTNKYRYYFVAYKKYNKQLRKRLYFQINSSIIQYNLGMENV